MRIFRRLLAFTSLASLSWLGASPVLAQPFAIPTGAAATYADLTDLAERSTLIVHAEIRRQTVVEPERAPGLAPGFARLYIEARTQGLLAGRAAIGESLTYLVDVPLDFKGKPPKLKKLQVILLAVPVPGRPGNLQLVSSESQLEYSPVLEQRLLAIMSDLVAPEAPPVVTGITDALAVRGTLAGESETQIFLATESGAPVSMTILRRPRQPPVWGVSWGEIIDQAARPPRPESLEWYRLACALPGSLPSQANLSRDREDRRLAAEDYQFVLSQLGDCRRNLTA
jgi:hypothetical protein